MLSAIEGILWLALTVFFEARSEPIVGQQAVAHVVLNRVSDYRYPDTVEGVVTAPKQFTPIKDTNVYRLSCRARTINPDAFRASVNVAVSVTASRLLAQPEVKYTHFWAPLQMRGAPKWSASCEPGTIKAIGKHIFCRVK